MVDFYDHTIESNKWYHLSSKWIHINREWIELVAVLSSSLNKTAHGSSDDVVQAGDKTSYVFEI